VVYIHGDLGDAKTPGQLNKYSAFMTAGRMQREVQRWSRVYGGPYIAIGRLGAFGSSGDHRKRRSLLEIRVVVAALDELKVRHGLRRFHLAGQSGGAHTVAGIAQMRSDVGCAVMAWSRSKRGRMIKARKSIPERKLYTIGSITSPPCNLSKAEG
jgi:hypothetical protein